MAGNFSNIVFLVYPILRPFDITHGQERLYQLRMEIPGQVRRTVYDYSHHLNSQVTDPKETAHAFRRWQVS